MPAPHGVAGIPVDASGGPTIDPTKNVLDLVAREIQRLNDLRDAETRRVDDLREAEIIRLNNLREAETRRTDDLRLAEGRRVNELLTLRAEFDEKLRDAEAKRIDAIRAVDVNAVAVASERATQQATVLATQVSASAETLRALVASSAAATATQLTQIITPITDRIGLLERAQYEGVGKSGVTDPQIAQLIVKMDSLVQSRASGEGAGAAHTSDTASTRWLVGILLGVPGIIVVVIELARVLTGK